MNKLKVLLVTILAFMLALTFTSGEVTVLSMMGYEPADSNRVWADNLFFQRMETRTGVGFTFNQFGDDSAYQARMRELRPGDPELPDVLFKAGLTPSQAASMLEGGILRDLAPLIPLHMPALSSLMEQNPEVRAAITLPGGAIPTLPFVALTPPQNALWVNAEWLKVLGMEMPANAEGFVSMLAAFKTRDPNRNGRADETALSFNGPYDIKYLAHAFGLIANDFNLFAEDGEAKFMPLQPRYRDFVRWLRGMWEARLLDRDGFAAVDSLRRQTDKDAVRTLGAFFAPLPSYLVPLEWAGEYVAMLPLSFEGARVYRPVSSPVFPGAFALTSACEDPPAALKWADYLYTQAGAVLAGVGEEGTDYVTDGDGTWRLLAGNDSQEYLANSIISSDFSAPGISAEAFEQQYTDPSVRRLVTQLRDLAAFSASPFPPFSLTAGEEAEIAPLQAALGRYVDESLARFVTGEWETSDEQFSAFEEGLQERDLDAFLAFWQRILARSGQ